MVMTENDVSINSLRIWSIVLYCLIPPRWTDETDVYAQRQEPSSPLGRAGLSLHLFAANIKRKERKEKARMYEVGV